LSETSPECGSRIFSDTAAMPGIVFIKAGTFGDTSWLDPKVHVDQQQGAVNSYTRRAKCLLTKTIWRLFFVGYYYLYLSQHLHGQSSAKMPG
jgi:hypothetical protein